MCVYMCVGFPGSSAGKESTCNAGGPGLIPGSRRSPGEGIGYPLQYSWASLVVQLVKKPSAGIGMGNTCKSMADSCQWLIHVNVWQKPLQYCKVISLQLVKINGKKKKRNLQFGRPGFDPWVGKIPWRRTWQPSLVFLPGEPLWTEEPGRLQSMGLQSRTWLSD